MMKMANVTVKKKLLFLVLCLASVTQGMYSTYFVSILTTIERIYQIKSKTAGAILSATEIGQIIGSPLIAYYGGRGNKPKWIAACMTFTALAALAATTPHFMLASRQQVTKNVLISPASASNAPPNALHGIEAIHDKNISTSLPISIQVLSTKQDHLCHIDLSTEVAQEDTFQQQHAFKAQNQQYTSSKDPIGKHGAPERQFSTQTMLIVFFICLLAIGFGSTAVTTLGIPFIDDIVTKEESPLYLGLTIGLRIFGPALGFLLGSVCIGLTSTDVFNQDHPLNRHNNESLDTTQSAPENYEGSDSAWWLGLVIISIPLICLAVPMYYLSFVVDKRDRRKRNCNDFEEITYQAAEDHDIGGSSDLQTHMLAAAAAVNLGLNTGTQLDVSSSRTSYSSELRSSCSHDTLQGNDRSHYDQQVITSSPLQQLSPISHYESSMMGGNFVRNVALDRPMLTSDSIIGKVGFEDKHDRLGRKTSLLTNLMITGKNNNIKPTNDWCTSTASIIVDNSDGLNQQSTSFTSNGSKNNVQHLSSPASSTISSSAAVVTAAAPPTTTTGSLSSSYSHRSTFDLSSTVYRLIRNKLLLLRMLSGVLHILPIAGFYTFLPKYLIEQYQLTSASASAISGLAGILFVGVGAFLGGTVVRIWNINSKIMTKWIAASSLFYAIGMIIMMNLSCKQGHQTIYYDSTIATTPIASMSTTTQTISAGYDSVLTQTAQCLSRCKCSSSVYNPVCANGTTFMSPCLAGCKSYTVADDKIIYEECGACSAGNSTASALSDTVSNQPGPSDHVNLNVAIQGHCPLICDNLKWYIIVFSIFTLIHSSSEAGSMMFNLRCVAQSDRTLALGLITLTSSLFGNIPCSIIYGSLIDLTCAHWDILPAEEALTVVNLGTNDEQLPQLASTTAQLKGACRTYHDDLFRIYLHGITAAIMLLAFIVDCIILRRSEEVDFYSESDSTKPESVRFGIQKSTETI